MSKSKKAVPNGQRLDELELVLLRTKGTADEAHGLASNITGGHLLLRKQHLEAAASWQELERRVTRLEDPIRLTPAEAVLTALERRIGCLEQADRLRTAGERLEDLKPVAAVPCSWRDRLRDWLIDRLSR
jgi:hypothetical protein